MSFPRAPEGPALSEKVSWLARLARLRPPSPTLGGLRRDFGEASSHAY